MTKQKEVLVAYLENVPKQFGWVKITHELDSQYETEHFENFENLLIELKKKGKISDFRKVYFDILPIYRTSFEGLNYAKNYNWEIKFSILVILKSKWIHFKNVNLF